MIRPKQAKACATNDARGGALLAVLWLAAALSAIAFSVALTVRGEIARSEAGLEGAQAHFIALAGLERARLYMNWGSLEKLPNGRPKYWDPTMPGYLFPFPGGLASVEIIPESSKLNVNLAKPEELMQVLESLGVPMGTAMQITAAIIDWRSGGDAMSPFDGFYLGLAPSFRARHASIEEIEELLFVQGVTPQLFYGRYEKAPDGSMYPVPGLRDCLTVYMPLGPGFDVNTAAPPVLAVAGMPLPLIDVVLKQRRLAPITREQFDALGLGGSGKVILGGGPFYTIRSTGRAFGPNGGLRETRRTVSCVLRRNDPEWRLPELFTVMRWREPDIEERPLFDLWPR